MKWQLSMWDILFNAFLFLFWMEIWRGDEERLRFNPYHATVLRVSGYLMSFLRPIFFRVPSRWIAVAALGFLMIFRAAVFHSLSMQFEALWILRMGFEAGLALGFLSSIFFSAVSFAIFLFKLWGFSLVYVRTEEWSSGNHSTEALFNFSRPFTNIPLRLRPLILLLFGIILAWLIPISGLSAAAFNAAQQQNALIGFFKLAICAVAGWVNILMIIVNFLMVLIIGSWISMFTRNTGIMVFCREWIDLLLGPIRNHPVRIGMLDLTPLIFFFLISWLIHPLLLAILYRSYSLLP